MAWLDQRKVAGQAGERRLGARLLAGAAHVQADAEGHTFASVGRHVFGHGILAFLAQSPIRRLEEKSNCEIPPIMQAKLAATNGWTCV